MTNEAAYYTVYKNGEYKGHAFGTLEGVTEWATAKWGKFFLTFDKITATQAATLAKQEATDEFWN